jgi:hypothetical protein
VWLGVMTAIATPFGPRSIEVGLLGASAASSVVTGIVLWLIAAPGGGGPSVVDDISIGAAGVAIGCWAVALGIAFGSWLVLIGVGIGAVGLGVLVRELLVRRALRRELER